MVGSHGDQYWDGFQVPIDKADSGACRLRQILRHADPEFRVFLHGLLFRLHWTGTESSGLRPACRAAMGSISTQLPGTLIVSGGSTA